jgi:hypothetical protein
MRFNRLYTNVQFLIISNNKKNDLKTMFFDIILLLLKGSIMDKKILSKITA